MMKITLGLPAQPGEEYPNGGGEGFWMSKIADSMTRLLGKTGAQLTRVCSEQSVPSGFQTGSDLYLTLCSRTAPSDSTGQRKGLDVCYEENSAPGKQAAEVFAARLKEVYPQPELAGTRPVPEGETVPGDDAPALTIKLAYHDNPQDEAWLVNSTEEIAEKLTEAAKEVLEIPETGLQEEAPLPDEENA